MSDLEKMPSHTRLYRRNATYYHRAVVPKDIIDSYGKTEETFSLKTKDHIEALRRVKIEAVRIDNEFEAHRQYLKRQTEPALEELTPAQIKHIGEVYYTHMLDEDADIRLDGFDEFIDTKDERIWISDPSELPRQTFEEHQEDTEALLADSKYDLARGRVDDFIVSEAEEVLTWINVNLNLSPQSSSWKLLYRELRQSIIRATESIKGRDEGNVVETPQMDSVSRVKPVASQYPMLSDALASWVLESDPNWSLKTKNSNTTWTDNFLSICGDKSLDAYVKADGLLFKHTIMKLPSNWKVRKDLKSLCIVDASEKASARQMEPMSISNINKGIGKVSTFWNWAAGQYFDGTAPHPLYGLKIKTKSDPRGQRDTLTSDQLTKMFNAPVYKGCKSEVKWKDEGQVILRDSPKYWVPLIGLFTGARLGEICQLGTNDIQSDQGIHYFNIDGVLAHERKIGEKGIKNAPSIRKIPIHPVLVEAGFLQYVEQQIAKGGQRLFPTLKVDSTGSYSDAFSKHFSRFLKECGAKTSKTSFHSFRHTLEDACRNAEVSGEIMDALQGHGSEGMKGRYGSRDYNIDVLARALNKIEYMGLDLSHLKL